MFNLNQHPDSWTEIRANHHYGFTKHNILKQIIVFKKGVQNPGKNFLEQIK